MREDWVECSLDRLIADNGLFKDGDWVEKKDQDPNGQVRLIQLSDIGDGDFRDKSAKYLTLKRAKEMNCSFLLLGDILIARMPDPLGRCTFFPFDEDEKFITAVDVAILRPRNESIDNNYLLHQINSPRIRNQIDKLKSGTTRKRISRKNLNKIPFAFSSLIEQKAIVKKIEELFSSLDSGIADLTKAQEQLKVYRQAVLKKAFEGELTKEWREKNEVANDWKDVNLSEISNACLGKMLDRKKNKGVLKPYLGNINVRWGKFDTNSLKTMRFEDSENNRFQLQKGDLVICEGGEPGRCAVWQGDEPVFIQKALHRIRFNTNCNPFYFYYYFFYQAKVGGLNEYFTGTTIKHLTGRKLKEFKVPLFSKQEQDQIVKEVESRLSVCDEVEKSIKESLDKATALRQSILKKAFEGSLLSDAEVARCKVHPEYEPARVLLGRIKEEKRNKK